jgi:hypothetical protein
MIADRRPVDGSKGVTVPDGHQGVWAQETARGHILLANHSVNGGQQPRNGNPFHRVRSPLDAVNKRMGGLVLLLFSPPQPSKMSYRLKFNRR